MVTKQSYEQLPFLEKEDQSDRSDSQEWSEARPEDAPSRQLWRRLLDCRLSILLVTNLILFSMLVYKSISPFDPTVALYSPVNHLISYKTVVFDGPRDPRTKYMPPEKGGLPDDNADQAWEELYHGTMTRLPRESAAKLVNWTSPIPGDEDHYITMLDVFHQLHCLNLIRRALYPERYNGTLWDGVEFQPIERHHTEHCVDALRQLIMCHSDVSTHYWRWEFWYDEPKTRTYSEVTHTCRDFEAIHEWAKEHSFERFDPYVHVEDPLRKGKPETRVGMKVY